MSSNAERSSAANSNIELVTQFAGALLLGKPVELGTNYTPVRGGYDVDVSTIDSTITPYGLDFAYKRAITDQRAIGVRRTARVELLRSRRLELTLTEYQQARLLMPNGEKKLVTSQQGKIVRGLFNPRGKYKPEIWHGVEVIANDQPADPLFVLSSAPTSADGRPSDILSVDIAFSSDPKKGVLSCAENGDIITDPRQGLYVLTDYLMRMAAAQASE